MTESPVPRFRDNPEPPMTPSILVARFVGSSVLAVSQASTSLHAGALSLPFGQIPQNFKTGWQTVLGLICMIGFVMGVLLIWGGVDKARKAGDFSEGKLGIFCGAVLAGAPVIMAALYFIFGLGEGVLQPLFN